MNNKNTKRRKYLLKLYPALVRVGLMPFVLVLAFNGNMFRNNTIVTAVISADGAVMMDASVYFLLVYLMSFPIFYFFMGLHLFDGEWVNLFRSFKGTFNMRYSLFRQPTQLDTDRVIRDFNHSIKKATLSILDDSIEFIIPLPKTVDAQKMMHVQEDTIRERVSLMLPAYALSSFELRGMMLVLIGSRY